MPIDLPDALFRKTKAVAALRGSSMKELIIRERAPKLVHRGAAEMRLGRELVGIDRRLRRRSSNESVENQQRTHS